MNKPRKVIAEALLNTIVTNCATLGLTFNLATRTGRMATNVDISQMPALLLYRPAETVKQLPERMALTKYQMHFFAWIVFIVDATMTTDQAYDDYICDLQDKIDAALLATQFPGQPQTLGGLVLNAWIDGMIHIDGGPIDNNIIIEIPITVETGIAF